MVTSTTYIPSPEKIHSFLATVFHQVQTGHPAAKSNLDKTRLLITYRISMSALAILLQVNMQSIAKTNPHIRLLQVAPQGPFQKATQHYRLD